MPHPTDGVLRRLLDEPAGVPPDDRAHVASCDVCGPKVATFRADADLAHTALAADPLSTVDVDVVGAWQRLSAELPTAPRRRQVVRPRGARRIVASLRRPAVAGVAAAVVLAGAGTAAAAG
jgi:hypothetical protein